MKIFLAIVAAIFAIGMFADKDEKIRQNLTFGFIAIMATISILSLVG